MTVTNTGCYYGVGIHMSDAKVELIDVALKGSGDRALHIPDSSETTLVATRCEFVNSEYGASVFGRLTSATFKNCVFNDNSREGIFVGSKATIHLHGEATTIHSNKQCGIFAYSSSKVLIHLPSHHNTFYNNKGDDRYTADGGTITNVED